MKRFASPGLALCLVLCGWKIAYADRPVDVVGAMRKVCETLDESKITDQGAKDRMCKPEMMANTTSVSTDRRLPLSARDTQLCSDLIQLTPAAKNTDALSSLEKACGLTAPSASIVPLDSILLNVVSGLGSHIQAIARQDIVDYVTSNLTDTFCNADPTKALALGTLFPTTCRLFDTFVTPIDSLTLSGVKSAFLVDIKALRSTLPLKLQAIATNFLQKHRNLQIPAGAGALIAGAIYEIFAGKRSLTELFQASMSWAESYYSSHTNTPCPSDATSSASSCRKICSLVTNPNDPECVLLFGIKVAMTFQNARTRDENLAADAPQLIQAAAVAFCSEHTSPPVNGTSCVIDAKYETRWHDRILRLYDAMYVLYEQTNSLTTDPAAQPAPATNRSALATGKSVTKTSFPGLGADIRAVLAAFLDLCSDKSSEYTNMESLLLAVADLALATVQEDIPATRTPLLSILDNPIIRSELGAGLDDSAKAAVNFVIALAAADSPADAKAVIDSVAAPAGTYKEKYGRSKLYFGIGSVIGPMLAQQYKMSAGSTTTNGFEMRFSAPVGVELMPSFLSGKYFNLGIAATAIDPLAMVASDKSGNTPDTNLGAVVDLGGYLRLGIAKSPISIVAGGSWRPGLHSASDCTSGCYKSTFELFAGIVADVPLFVLH